MRAGVLSTVLSSGAIIACLGCVPFSAAQLDGGGFAATGTDTVARFFHAAGTLDNGLVMVSGGLGLQVIPPSLFSRNTISFYDAQSGTFTNHFTPLGGGPAVTPTLATARSSHTQTTLLDGRVLITGGHIGATGTSPGTPTDSVEIFDPQTGIMTAGPAMSVARTMHSATLLPNGKIVIAGGATWQIYDPATNSWFASTNLARSRTAHAAVLLDDFAGVVGDERVLLIGGSGSGGNTLELLNPAANSTTLLTETLGIAVDDVAAVVLDDGCVFIVGGQNLSTGDTINITYLYDPVADALASGPPLPNRTDGIADHELVKLGRYVLVFGGEQQLSGTDTELDYAAIYDSATNHWLDDGTMINPHDDFASVTLDPTDILLIAGGAPFFGEEAPTAQVEVFTLTLDPWCKLGDANCDGFLDLFDIDPFVIALTTPEVWVSTHSCGLLCTNDINGDGVVDLFDIDPFVLLLTEK